MNLKQAILDSGIKQLIKEVLPYQTDLEILYIYDRYMKSLLSQILYLNNIQLKEKLRDEFDYLTLKCEHHALELLNQR